MELKKSKKADLKNKQGLFLQVGMILAMALVFVSFQWSVEKGDKPVLIGNEKFIYDEVLIPITRVEEKKIIEKPVFKPESFIITEDPIIDEAVDIFGSEVIPDMQVQVIPYDDEPEVIEDRVFMSSEVMPQFPGGENALLCFLSKNTIYPELAKELGVQGRVFVQFVINKKGNVERIQIARGVDPILDNEAMRVVGLMPKWTPGLQSKKPVMVSYTVPINFKLN